MCVMLFGSAYRFGDIELIAAKALQNARRENSKFCEFSLSSWATLDEIKEHLMSDIVVCDDEPHITRAIEIKLRKAGYAVTTCEHGADALRAIRLKRPSLLITDCQMPVMSGLELLSHINNDPELRVMSKVMLTAKGYELNEVELKKQLGVCRLIHKPFSPRDLVIAVDEIFGTQPARDGVNVMRQNNTRHASARPVV